MLKPHEFTVGPIADAQPLSLLLPRTKHEQPLLIIGTADERLAVFIGQLHRFDSMTCAGNEHWKGVIVPNVSIEVDDTSLYDPESEYTPNGAMLREGDRLAMAVKARSSHGFSEQVRIPVVSGLPVAGERYRAGFYKWQLVLGEGDEKRILREVSVEPIQSPER